MSKKQVIRAADLAIFQLNQPKVEPIPIYLKNPYISTSKLIAYSHNAETKLKVFQATQVRLYKLFPFLFVPPTGGYSFHFRQEPSHIGGPNKLRQPPIQLLLTHEFGLNLQIDDQKFAKQLQTEVIASLGQNQIITANLSKLYDLYFDSISRQFKPDETDVKLTLKLLSIDGFPMLNSIKNALRRILPQHDQYKEQFAQQLFNKLNAFTPDKSEEFISRQYRELRYINNALGELPLDSYNISLERLNELAKDRYDREFNYNVFKFLANYGDAALPTLFYLLEDDDPEPLVDSQHRSRLISTVMQNICLIGLGADKLQNQMIIERIYKWLNSDDYPLSGRNKRPTISTMIGLGAEPEKLWLHIKSNEKNALSYKRFKKITEYKLNKKCKYH
ncbi:MAG: hypothetical protein COB13_006920 [OCS116 cluster bacterium]|nr:hypothetical protein [OCS116 cluster bacterium]